MSDSRIQENFRAIYNCWKSLMGSQCALTVFEEMEPQ